MNLARLAPLFALLAAPFCVPSQAADYEVAPSLVCDTQEQVQRFVAFRKFDTSEPLPRRTEMGLAISAGFCCLCDERHCCDRRVVRRWRVAPVNPRPST